MWVDESQQGQKNDRHDLDYDVIHNAAENNLKVNSEDKSSDICRDLTYSYGKGGPNDNIFQLKDLQKCLVIDKDNMTESELFDL